MYSMDHRALFEVKARMIEIIRNGRNRLDEKFTGYKALVADDDRASTFIMKYILKRIGLEITIVSDGLECYKQTIKNEYDIVFMDCYMPTMDGLEATAKIREAGFHQLPVICVTGAITLSIDQLLACGFSDGLFKPYIREDILRILNNHINTLKYDPIQSLMASYH